MVTVLTVILSLYRNKISLLNCFVYIALAKNLREFQSDQKYFAN